MVKKRCESNIPSNQHILNDDDILECQRKFTIYQPIKLDDKAYNFF